MTLSLGPNVLMVWNVEHGVGQKMGEGSWGVGSWGVGKLGSWEVGKLEVGSWEVGSWKLEVGSWKFYSTMLVDKHEWIYWWWEGADGADL